MKDASGAAVRMGAAAKVATLLVLVCLNVSEGVVAPSGSATHAPQLLSKLVREHVVVELLHTTAASHRHSSGNGSGSSSNRGRREIDVAADLGDEEHTFSFRSHGQDFTVCALFASVYQAQSLG